MTSVLEKEAFVNEERLMRPVSEETALRVLQAVVEEAHGRVGVYVTRDRVMQRVNIEDSEHFKAIAEHLEQRGWIAAAGVDYLAFVVTICGHAKVVSRDSALQSCP